MAEETPEKNPPPPIPLRLLLLHRAHLGVTVDRLAQLDPEAVDLLDTTLPAGSPIGRSR